MEGEEAAKRIKLEEEAATTTTTKPEETDEVKAAKEFEVPLVAINKILKAALPDGANCTKDAKSAFSKAAGIFILYITACANELAKTGKRSTINSQDVMTALTELGYASFIPHLESTLEKMRMESIARKSHKQKPKKGSSDTQQQQQQQDEEEEDGAGGGEDAAAGAAGEEEETTDEPVVGALALL